ncbi:MAG: hypothetical protein CO093_02885 [Alphaproteobacteria bacterium CG_4_9_14_3_um_filter_47_13]|nr:MAG: hypothetical protein CO093_02885 [Alphaproteobacteria bacterium CG_4_9_14_3_um_filter_47_13]
MFEQGLPEQYTQPKNWLWGEFENARHAILRFGKLSLHKNPLAHIVFVEGLGEYAEKNFELARDFNKISCNFSILDRQGQGKSTRYFPNAPHKQHSQGVDHDIADLVQYCKEHIPENEPIVLLGQSTGGLIALLALEEHKDLFKAAILSSPLLGIKDPRIKGKEALFSSIPIFDCIKEMYVPGGGDWKPRSHPEKMHNPEDFSSHPDRSLINDYWPENDPDLRAGDPTIGWLWHMCKAITKIRNPETLKNITQPVLIISNGDDVLIDNTPIDAIVSQLPNGLHTHHIKGKHDSLMEDDRIRNQNLKEIEHLLKNSL